MTPYDCDCDYGHGHGLARARARVRVRNESPSIRCWYCFDDGQKDFASPSDCMAQPMYADLLAVRAKSALTDSFRDSGKAMCP